MPYITIAEWRRARERALNDAGGITDDTPTSSLPLPSRALDIFAANSDKWKTVGDVRRTTDLELVSGRNAGWGTLQDIRALIGYAPEAGPPFGPEDVARIKRTEGRPRSLRQYPTSGRNAEIIEARRKGETLAVIGERFGLSKQRVFQIVRYEHRRAFLERQRDAGMAVAPVSGR